MKIGFLERFLPRSMFGDVFSFPGGPQLPGLGNLALMEEERELEARPRARRLVVRAQQGDGTAFEGLYRQHSKRVYSLCFWLLGTSRDADEVTEAAFLRAFRKISTFASDAAFSAWLYRTTLELVLGRLQEDPSWESSPEESAPGRDKQQCDAASSVPGSPGSMNQATLEAAVRRLPARYRVVFVLHDVFGYQDDEIANLTACERDTARIRLHQARICLRRMLRDADQLSSPTADPIRQQEPVR